MIQVKKQILILLLSIITITTGCTQQTWVEQYYVGPSWAPDGRIVAWKHHEERYRRDFGANVGVKNIKDSIVIMNADGSGEQELFEINGASIGIYEGGGHTNMSPDGTKISISGAIFTVTGNMIGDIPFQDWSPLSDKVIYVDRSASPSILGIYDLVTKQDTILTYNAYEATWRYGERIVFAYNVGYEGSKLSTIYPNGTDLNINHQVKGGAYNISPSQNHLVYYTANSGVSGTIALNMINLDTLATRNVGLLDTDTYEFYGLQLSPDGNKFIFSKLNNGLYHYEQIWTMDVDGTNIQRIK